MRVTDESGKEVAGDPNQHIGIGAATQMPIDDVSNPLGEPLIPVKVREGVEFMNQGVLRRSGEEFDMPISMARHASMYVVERKPDGSIGSIPHESPTVARANVAGRPRHERIGELEAEIKRLDERKAQVQATLDHEKSQEAATVASSGPVQGDRQPAQPSPGGTLATPVGGPGAVQPGTTNQEPRRGEGGGGNLAEPIR